MHSGKENILQQDCALEQQHESFFNFSFRGFSISLSKNAHFPTSTTGHRRKEKTEILVAISTMLDDILVEGVVAKEPTTIYQGDQYLGVRTVKP